MKVVLEMFFKLSSCLLPFQVSQHHSMTIPTVLKRKSACLNQPRPDLVASCPDRKCTQSMSEGSISSQQEKPETR